MTASIMDGATMRKQVGITVASNGIGDMQEVGLTNRNIKGYEE